MPKLFHVNENLFYAKNPQAEKNIFISKVPDDKPLPTFSEVREKLPRPVWDGHEDAVKCYYKAWEIAFGNLRKAKPEAGFVSDFIDTAFNGFLFMWDSAFIVMFGKYASRIFDFQKTLDNFYSHQHKDGFICREIYEAEAGEHFSRDDPGSTGPNLLPWAEWEYFLSTGDKDRLSAVFDPLCAYHRWLMNNRSWPDGSYFSCGLASGMDNQPRQAEGYSPVVSHGFMSWIDTCSQQYLSAKILVNMAEILGREDDVLWLRDEAKLLKKTINETMWDEASAFYFDKRRDGSLSFVKTVGAYWTLLAGLVPEERVDRFVSHLCREDEFKRPVMVPSLSFDHPKYNKCGGYWLGGVWAPTNYMVLRGLYDHKKYDLAYEIAENYLSCVVNVFNETGTLFENYAPERHERGNISRPDFVGWTGLAPISIMFEYVFGIHPDFENNKIVWTVNRTERHGIFGYPFGDATIDLICEERKNPGDKPEISIRSDRPVTVEVIFGGKSEIMHS